MAEHCSPGLVGVPAVDWMWSESAVSLIELVRNLSAGSTYALGLGSGTIASKRNSLVSAMLRDPSLQWLLFLDSDMTVPPDTVARLLAHEADVAGALCTLRRPPYSFTAGHLHDRGSSTDLLRPTDSAEFGWRPLDAADLGRGAVEVEIIGTGCTLVHRRVLEAVPPPWFVANDHPSSVGMNEDLNFILRARDLGFRVVCDTSLQVGHVGAQPVTPAFAYVWQVAQRVAGEGA